MSQRHGVEESVPEQEGTARGWSPGWAVTLALLGAVIALIPLGYGIALLTGGSSVPDGRDDGFATAIGQVAVFASAVVLSLLIWFLWRGGKVTFVMGAALVVLGLAWYATVLLP